MNATSQTKTTEPTSVVAAALAKANGLTLTPARSGGYILSGRDWAIELFPFTQTVVATRGAPRLVLPEGWALSDCVEAAINAGRKS